MKSETVIAIFFGVAGLALTYYLFKKSPSATAGVVGDTASQRGTLVGDGAGSLVSPGNNYAGTPNHSAPQQSDESGYLPNFTSAGSE